MGLGIFIFVWYHRLNSYNNNPHTLKGCLMVMANLLDIDLQKYMQGKAKTQYQLKLYWTNNVLGGWRLGMYRKGTFLLHKIM